MNVFGALHKMTKLILTACLLLTAGVANAADILDYLTDTDGKYAGPTVEQNIISMDTDKNGFADVLEVRAFLALKHGKDYQKEVLDRWEVRSLGGGCPIPFAKEFVSDSSK
jgi:hypothetical protein